LPCRRPHRSVTKYRASKGLDAYGVGGQGLVVQGEVVYYGGEDRGEASMIPDRWSKTIALGVGAFGFLINLAQFTDLKCLGRIAVGAGTGLCLVVAGTFLFRAKRYENALSLPKFPKRLSSVDGFRLGYVLTEAGFSEVTETSEKIYGPDNVPRERSLSWWKQYRRGTFAAYRDLDKGSSTIAGYVSIWPIKKTTYEKLRRGRLREAELSLRSIDGDKTSSPRKYWYVSNIVVARDCRRLLPELLAQAIRNWIDAGNLSDSVAALAFAYSPQGEHLLNRFGFRKRLEKSGDGWPIFELEITREGLITSLANALATTEVRPKSGLQQALPARSLGGRG
jgi:hypothetical protein